MNVGDRVLVSGLGNDYSGTGEVTEVAGSWITVTPTQTNHLGWDCPWEFPAHRVTLLPPVSSDLKPTNPKDIVGSDKLPLHLWPATATGYGCLALLDGALKYGRSNWRVAGVRLSIYVDAIQRHTNALFEDEWIDPDSGVPHVSHILACAAIIADAEAAGKLEHDEQFPGGYREMIENLTPHVARLKDKHVDKFPKHYSAADAAKA